MLQVSVATTVKLLGNIVCFLMMFDHAEHQPSYDFHTKHRNCQSLEVQSMRQHGPRVQGHLLASVCYTLSSTSAQKRNKGAMLLYVEWPQQCLAGPLVPPRHRHTVQFDKPPAALHGTGRNPQWGYRAVLQHAAPGSVAPLH